MMAGWSEHQSPWGQEERAHGIHPKNAAIWADFTGRQWDKEAKPVLLLKLEGTQQGVLAHLPPPGSFNKTSCSLSGQSSPANAVCAVARLLAEQIHSLLGVHLQSEIDVTGHPKHFASIPRMLTSFLKCTESL